MFYSIGPLLVTMNERRISRKWNRDSTSRKQNEVVNCRKMTNNKNHLRYMFEWHLKYAQMPFLNYLHWLFHLRCKDMSRNAIWVNNAGKLYRVQLMEIKQKQVKFRWIGYNWTRARIEHYTLDVWQMILIL